MQKTMCISNVTRFCLVRLKDGTYCRSLKSGEALIPNAENKEIGSVPAQFFRKETILSWSFSFRLMTG